MRNEYGLDVSYFENKLNRVLRDISRYTPEEAFNEFSRMAETAIPRKPFDISEHEWSDVIAEIKPESGDTLVIKSHGSWLSFDKNDVIAMAKDRGVTGEDLK